MAKPADAKKAAQREALARALATQAALKALLTAPDLLAPLPAFRRYARRGVAAEVSYHAGAGALPAGALEWAFELTKRHMAALYAACPGWEGGWSDKGKRRELAHDDARFLLAAAAAPDEGGGAGTLAAAAPADGGASPPAPAPVALPPGAPLAFVHLRFEEERGAPVAYVYEIQVEGAAQGRGVGRFLMQAVELVARQRGLAAVMLTVFRANAAAGAMYRALGYVSDASSPAEREGAGYEILSKRLPPPRAAAPAAAGAAAAALAGA